jgi:hypothetical protein
MALFVISVVLAGISVYLVATAISRRTKSWLLRALAGVSLLLACAASNPLVRLIVFAPQAEEARAQMLRSARQAGCVGQSTAWLLARYGPPSEVAKDGPREHWWYKPGPWYIVHEDYVGFEIRSSRITSAYIQVN